MLTCRKFRKWASNIPQKRSFKWTRLNKVFKTLVTFHQIPVGWDHGILRFMEPSLLVTQVFSSSDAPTNFSKAILTVINPLIAISSKHLQARLPWRTVNHPKDVEVLKWKKKSHGMWKPCQHFWVQDTRSWPPYGVRDRGGGGCWRMRFGCCIKFFFCKLLVMVVSTRHTSQWSSAKMCCVPRHPIWRWESHLYFGLSPIPSYSGK